MRLTTLPPPAHAPLPASLAHVPHIGGGGVEGGDGAGVGWGGCSAPALSDADVTMCSGLHVHRHSSDNTGYLAWRCIIALQNMSIALGLAWRAV